MKNEYVKKWTVWDLFSKEEIWENGERGRSSFLMETRVTCRKCGYTIIKENSEQDLSAMHEHIALFHYREIMEGKI